jgi:hypothetical protein
MKGRERFTTRDISKWLDMRRRDNQQTILLLGSQAGAFYRSLSFYNYCQQYTIHNLQLHPPIWSFHECYEVLMHNRLGEREIHTVLHDIFKNITNAPEPHEGDDYLAEIVRKGYFREIISMNIDDLVEQALHYAGFIEKQDFEVFIAGKEPSPQQRELPYRLTKVFGDWLSRAYTIYDRQAYIADDSELNHYLHTLLHGDVLAVGVDHLWDSAILPLLHDSPTTLWFVNEDETSINHPQIASLLHQKQEKAVAIVGENYGHEDFWRILYQHLHSKNAEAIEYKIPITANKNSQKQKKKATRVFYLYCDEDLPVMEKLWMQLKVLRTNNLIEEWHRGMLQPGDQQQLMQERYLKGSQLIFVGFSSSFLASEYYEQALQALKLSSGGTATLVPLLLRPIGNWKRTPFGEIMPLPQGGKTLSRMTSTIFEEELSKIAEAIHDLVIKLSER